MKLEIPEKVAVGSPMDYGEFPHALFIFAPWVHAKKVMDHAALRSDLRSQKS